MRHHVIFASAIEYLLDKPIWVVHEITVRLSVRFFYHMKSFEPRCEKTGLWGFRPGPIQTGLYNYRKWLEI